MPPSSLASEQTGCTVLVPNNEDALNQYVKIEDTRECSYGGPKFTGGVYAMEWTDSFIKV